MKQERKGEVFSIEGSASFARSLAMGLKARFEDKDDPLSLPRVLLLVPTRRAVMSVARAFQDLDPTGVTLMPQILPLGDVGEDDLSLEVGLDGGLQGFEDLEAELPPAIAPLQRQLLLARLISAAGIGNPETAQSAAVSAALAGELARFFDNVETEEADLSRLDQLVPENLADHWQVTVEFLEILTKAWPGLLEERGVLNPVDRRSKILRQLASEWTTRPHGGPVVIAGSTGSIPSTQALMQAVLTHEEGLLVLPGLDQTMDPLVWAKVEETHPQFGLKQLLEGLELQRTDVARWSDTDEGEDDALGVRRRVLSQVMLPAEATEGWLSFSRDKTVRGDLAKAFAGLSRIDADDPRLEALTIALIIRETLETPGNTVALVTPDRGLARRVSMELRRWDLEIDDSAGRPLLTTPVGSYLSLILDVVATQFAPVSLLALLKHPLTGLGWSRPHLRRVAAEFEMSVLRGVRPAAGLEGLRRKVDGDKHARERIDFSELLERLEEGFSPLLRNGDENPQNLVEAHLQVAEALAASESEEGALPGAERLWVGEAGESAASFFSELLLDVPVLERLSLSEYPALFEVLLGARTVRVRFGAHPRAFIWGPLEARLQSADVIVLGGLVEKTWPQAADADPWLSRPMRRVLEMSQPERRIGQSAHDFVQLAEAPRVILTRAIKVDGVQTVASRWLMRLENMLKGLEAESLLEPDEPYLDWARLLDRPEGYQPCEEPRPTPPVEARPRQLSVTRIETWLRDPYAIYARCVLGLEVLDDLDLPVGPLERGNAIHKALERFLVAHPDTLPEDSAQLLMDEAMRAFDEVGASEEAYSFWVPRFARLADWFLGFEETQRTRASTLAHEAKGETALKGPGGTFTLTARADRFDLLDDGTTAIYDYKTGRPPSKLQVESLLAPQLPLEGVILRDGGFEHLAGREASELGYIRLQGGSDPGSATLFTEDIGALVAAAEEELLKFIARYDDPTMPYRSRVRPMLETRIGPYDHLARVKEWSVYDGEEGGGA